MKKLFPLIVSLLGQSYVHLDQLKGKYALNAVGYISINALERLITFV